MPLSENAINEILPFAPEGLAEAGDVMPLDEYADHTMRRRGHQPGIALREMQNREARQATHMAAGLAQFIANRFKPGILDDGDLDRVELGLLEAIGGLRYELCEFYFFRSPVLRPGFQPAQGGLLANAQTLYPEAWEYLVNGAGQTLCKTEAEWLALTKATFATLDDGTAITWNGIGGAPFYAPNTSTGGLRLPDLRGMYQEAAGFDALGVGAVHGDGFRNFTGNFFSLFGTPQESNGIFKYAQGEVDSNVSGVPMGTGNWKQGRLSILSSRAIPTSNKNQPRAWGALPCVYLGQPAA